MMEPPASPSVMPNVITIPAPSACSWPTRVWDGGCGTEASRYQVDEQQGDDGAPCQAQRHAKRHHHPRSLRLLLAHKGVGWGVRDRGVTISGWWAAGRWWSPLPGPASCQTSSPSPLPPPAPGPQGCGMGGAGQRRHDIRLMSSREMMEPPARPSVMPNVITIPAPSACSRSTVLKETQHSTASERHHDNESGELHHNNNTDNNNSGHFCGVTSHWHGWANCALQDQQKCISKPQLYLQNIVFTANHTCSYTWAHSRNTTGSESGGGSGEAIKAKTCLMR